MKVLEASLLAFNQNEEKMISQLIEIKKSGINHIHYDVMDGIFVKNKAFFGEHLDLIKKMGFIISVHLMVKDVNKFVDFFLNYNIDYLTFHFEPISKEESLLQIDKIKKRKIKCGIAIKPDSKINDIMDLINSSSIITIMSVEPGMGGQEFLLKTVDKLKEIRDFNKNIIIQVDGGLNSKNSEIIKKYTNFFVMGTFLINNIKESKIILEKIIG